MPSFDIPVFSFLNAKLLTLFLKVFFSIEAFPKAAATLKSCLAYSIRKWLYSTLVSFILRFEKPRDYSKCRLLAVQTP